MAIEVTVPFDTYYDASGAPLDSGYIYIGTESLNPETNPISIFWDAAMTIPAANPVRTTNGYPARNGSPARIYCSDQYSITVKDKNGVLAYSSLSGNLGSVVSYVDTVADLALLNNANTASGTVIVKDLDRGGTFIWSSTGTANGGTVFAGANGYWNRQYSGVTNVKWFGAVGDGATIDTEALQAAINIGKQLYIPSGTYLVDSMLTVGNFKTSIVGENTLSTKIKTSSWLSGAFVISLDLGGVASSTGSKFENFTIDGNNQLVGGLLIDRPYDNISVIDVNVYNIHANYNCIYVGGDDVGQTLYMRNVLTMHYDASPTVPSVYIKNLQESKFDLCKFWGAKYIAGVPYAGAVPSIEIFNCRSLSFEQVSIVSSSGIKISCNNQDVSQIAFNYPIFEDTNNKVELIGQSGTFLVREITIKNPRHEAPNSGGYILGNYSYYNRVESNYLNLNVTLNASSAYNTIETLYSSSITDSGTKNIIVRHPDSAISSYNIDYNLGLKGFVRPTVDNTYSCGTATFRWSVVYAGTGTINTSDAREKTFLDINTAETNAAKQIKTMMRKFKFNDAIEAKGIDNARIHYGVGAQEIMQVMVDNGLDPMKYAFVCYDEWDEELDDEGNVIVPAGNRYGIRYEELLCFIISAM